MSKFTLHSGSGLPWLPVRVLEDSDQYGPETFGMKHMEKWYWRTKSWTVTAAIEISLFRIEASGGPNSHQLPGGFDGYREIPAETDLNISLASGDSTSYQINSGDLDSPLVEDEKILARFSNPFNGNQAVQAQIEEFNTITDVLSEDPEIPLVTENRLYDVLGDGVFTFEAGQEHGGTLANPDVTTAQFLISLNVISLLYNAGYSPTEIGTVEFRLKAATVAQLFLGLDASNGVLAITTNELEAVVEVSGPYPEFGDVEPYTTFSTFERISLGAIGFLKIDGINFPLYGSISWNNVSHHGSGSDPGYSYSTLGGATPSVEIVLTPNKFFTWDGKYDEDTGEPV